VSTFPWYEEVQPDTPITQGDFIDPCPVLAFDEIPQFTLPIKTDAVIARLQGRYGIERNRVVVMTQACDLAQGKARNVILCPVYHLDDYKTEWEKAQKTAGRPVRPTEWPSKIAEIKKGRILNLCLLAGSDSKKPGGVSIPCQVVDFLEVFSMPLEIVKTWVLSQNTNRLRLLPPYREHLSQAFARYFMRVALPVDIDIEA
jgi:hypothetical protein